MYRTSVATNGNMFVLSREWSTDGCRWSVTERIKTKRLEVLRANAPDWAHKACTMLCAKHFEDIMFTDPIELKDVQVPIRVDAELAKMWNAPALAVDYADAEVRTVAMLADPEAAKTAEVQSILSDMASALNITVEEAKAIFSTTPSAE